MSISCKFHLTRSSNIYYCGERIEGSVTLYPLKSRQVEAICLEFCGQTQVAWWDLDKTAVANNIVHNDYSTQEVRQKTLFSNRQKHVCDQLKLANTQLLQPHTEYGYQFSFPIPQQLPATSRCPLGECEYVLQLVLQHTKKANKEFHQRITVKRKLDLSRHHLTYKEPCSVTQQNQFGHLVLSTPCTGFTPGQRVPYLVNFQAAQMNCKVLIQLNCFIRCRSKTPSDSEKLIKQIINFRKHCEYGKTLAHLTMPLDSYISTPPGEVGEELILAYEYLLEALVINASKNIVLSVAIPLAIGTTPCFKFAHEESDGDSSMCYDNYGSPHGAPLVNTLDLATMANCSTEIQQIYETMGLLPLKSRKTHLRRSLRYCYKKISKMI